MAVSETELKPGLGEKGLLEHGPCQPSGGDASHRLETALEPASQKCPL